MTASPELPPRPFSPTATPFPEDASGTLTGAKRRLLELLKRRGESTAGHLAEGLGLTAVAVRQHLQALSERGLVEHRRRPPTGRGRPSTLWALSDAADALFPDSHGDLAVELLASTRETFGEEGVRRLLARRADSQVESYRELLPEGDLGARVEALARRRSAEGYMAETVEESPGSYLLIEHHCPICVAAQRCQGLCAAELDVFRRALGEEAQVERTEHLLAGGERCVYRIRDAATAPPSDDGEETP